jgi:hypothetical protein
MFFCLFLFAGALDTIRASSDTLFHSLATCTSSTSTHSTVTNANANISANCHANTSALGTDSAQNTDHADIAADIHAEHTSAQHWLAVAALLCIHSQSTQLLNGSLNGIADVSTDVDLLADDASRPSSSLSSSSSLRSVSTFPTLLATALVISPMSSPVNHVPSRWFVAHIIRHLGSCAVPPPSTTPSAAPGSNTPHLRGHTGSSSSSSSSSSVPPPPRLSAAHAHEAGVRAAAARSGIALSRTLHHAVELMPTKKLLLLARWLLVPHMHEQTRALTHVNMYGSEQSLSQAAPVLASQALYEGPAVKWSPLANELATIGAVPVTRSSAQFPVPAYSPASIPSTSASTSGASSGPSSGSSSGSSIGTSPALPSSSSSRVALSSAQRSVDRHTTARSAKPSAWFWQTLYEQVMLSACDQQHTAPLATGSSSSSSSSSLSSSSSSTLVDTNGGWHSLVGSLVRILHAAVPSTTVPLAGSPYLLARYSLLEQTVRTLSAVSTAAGAATAAAAAGSAVSGGSDARSRTDTDTPSASQPAFTNSSNSFEGERLTGAESTDASAEGHAAADGSGNGDEADAPFHTLNVCAELSVCAHALLFAPPKPIATLYSAANGNTTVAVHSNARANMNTAEGSEDADSLAALDFASVELWSIECHRHRTVMLEASLALLVLLLKGCHRFRACFW